ncbi:hypothetical protein WJX77_002315 [Trebouxia sp. C0004]
MLYMDQILLKSSHMQPSLQHMPIKQLMLFNRAASVGVSVATGAYKENDGEQKYIGWGGLSSWLFCNRR